MRISQIVPGGAGMARLTSGQVVFVPGGLPGDLIRARATSRRGGTVWVDAFEVVEPGPGQVSPPCRHSQACGGCDLMRLNSEQQRSVKLQVVEQALRRTGGIESASCGFVASDDAWGYRERIRLHIRGGRLGFFKEGTHQLVEIDSCMVAHPAINEALTSLIELGDERRDSYEGVSSIELRALSRPLPGATTRLLVQIHSQRERATSRRGRVTRRATNAGRGLGQSALLEAICAKLPKNSIVRIDGAEVESAPDHVSERAFLAALPGGFSQVNPSVNRRMIDYVVELALSHFIGDFADIYCGNGNFSLPLLSCGLNGIGVESNPQAVELAKHAYLKQRTQSWGEGKFFAMDSEAFAGGLRGRSQQHEMVIVDPPRSGAKPILEWLTRACQKLMVMVSCDPVTLARDLKFLIAHGFVLGEIRAFDMFPQTHHVETVAILQKN